MCLLAVAKDRKMTDDEIINSNNSNPHGIGVGWIEPVTRKVCYRKGMSLIEFQEFYKDFDITPHVVHFRYSSIGGICPELTHPFIVSPKSSLQISYRGSKSILFHNGHYSGWKDDLLQTCRGSGTPIPSGRMSDTRALAVVVSVLSENYLEYIDGKYAIISHDGIKKYGEFILSDGIYFSNSSYKSCLIRNTIIPNTETYINHTAGSNSKKDRKYPNENKMTIEAKRDMFDAWNMR
jgi:hypothetical protein